MKFNISKFIIPACLLLCSCALPLSYWDYEVLGDNLVDSSIKHNLVGPGETSPDPQHVNTKKKFRDDFLYRFPINSFADSAKNYMISIGSECTNSSNSTEQYYHCEYRREWPQIVTHLFSHEQMGIEQGLFIYAIKAIDNHIVDVEVDIQLHFIDTRINN